MLLLSESNVRAMFAVATVTRDEVLLMKTFDSGSKQNQEAVPPTLHSSFALPSPQEGQQRQQPVPRRRSIEARVLIIMPDDDTGGGIDASAAML